MSDGLFEVEPSAALHKGDRVRVQTMWGAEHAIVREVTYEDGFPMVMCDTPSGDRITINIARVTPVEEES